MDSQTTWIGKKVKSVYEHNVTSYLHPYSYSYKTCVKLRYLTWRFGAMLASPATESVHENWFIQAFSPFGPNLAGWTKIFAALVCHWRKRNLRTLNELKNKSGCTADCCELMQFADKFLLRKCRNELGKKPTPSNFKILNFSIAATYLTNQRAYLFWDIF